MFLKQEENLIPFLLPEILCSLLLKTRRTRSPSAQEHCKGKGNLNISMYLEAVKGNLRQSTGQYSLLCAEHANLLPLTSYKPLLGPDDLFAQALSQYLLYCWCLQKDPLFSTLYLVYTAPASWEKTYDFLQA